MIGLELPLPDVKTMVVDIPYSDGSIDMTEATGEVHYKNRENIKFTFIHYDSDFSDFQRTRNQLAAAIHGRKVKVILDNEPDYYYMMRLSIATQKVKKKMSEFIIEGTAEPFKYSTNESGEDWLWDTFDFETGVIMTLENIDVNGETRVPIDTTVIFAVPEFDVKSTSSLRPLRVVYNGQSYAMRTTGKHYFPNLRYDHTTTEIVLDGEGVVTVKFRGRYL